MSGVFGSEYASAYDQLYTDKDYVAECRLIDRLLRTYRVYPIRSILDLGCGTGNHALPLVELGYNVVGVDRSIAMLDSARRKAANHRLDGKATFYQADIASFHTDTLFDAALMMFAVLGYQVENTDVLAALKMARNNTCPGGLFLFDVWYGPAVLRQGPGDRVKTIPTEKGQILRTASGRLDTRRHLCRINYHLWKLEANRLVAETEEDHVMRYFFPLELTLFLQYCGFDLVKLGGFPEFDSEPDETTWNVCGVARAI